MWAVIWHPFVSGPLARAQAMVNLMEYLQAKVWFPVLAEHSHRRVIERGERKPMPERLPFWPAPLPQVIRPSQ
jgi:hypothetical protein